MTPNPDRIDQVVLAALWLTAHRKGEEFLYSAWKGLDWNALGRLHERGLIEQPRNRNKSVTFTQEGAAIAEAAFESLCGGDTHTSDGADSDMDEENIVPTPGTVTSPAAEHHPFPSSALKLWESVPEEVRPQILANVYCAHCRGARRIVDFTGIPDEHNDLILRGFCADCGHVIVRLLETGEAFPPPQPSPGFR